MATFNSFEEIQAWRRARELTAKVYSQTHQSNFLRDIGLREQMRRASVSIVSNIAEGFERNGRAEFIHFLSQAKGSAGELRAQLYVAYDVGYFDAKTFETLFYLLLETSRLISGLMKYLQQSDVKGAKFKTGKGATLNFKP